MLARFAEAANAAVQELTTEDPEEGGATADRGTVAEDTPSKTATKKKLDSASREVHGSSLVESHSCFDP